MYDKPTFLSAGDQALLVEMGDTINDETNTQIHNLTLKLEKLNLKKQKLLIELEILKNG